MKNNFGEQEPVLCVPPSKIDIFLDQYHTSLLGGHSGITKCYQTLRQRIYCPNLPYYVRLDIISCHICQLFKNSERFDQPLMRRFYDINTPTMTNISIERSRNLDRSFRNIYIIPSFPTREQHAHSVQNARLRFNKLNQSYSCYPREKR